MSKGTGVVMLRGVGARAMAMPCLARSSAFTAADPNVVSAQNVAVEPANHHIGRVLKRPPPRGRPPPLPETRNKQPITTPDKQFTRPWP
jgi:hypothetical protein